MGGCLSRTPRILGSSSSRINPPVLGSRRWSRALGPNSPSLDSRIPALLNDKPIFSRMVPVRYRSTLRGARKTQAHLFARRLRPGLFQSRIDRVGTRDRIPQRSTLSKTASDAGGHPQQMPEAPRGGTSQGPSPRPPASAYRCRSGTGRPDSATSRRS